jgi:hypothetical protein
MREYYTGEDLHMSKHELYEEMLEFIALVIGEKHDYSQPDSD